MTDDDDFKDLKAAMEMATPEPDAARRTANLARAQEGHARQQRARRPATPTLWQRVGVRGGAWAGLGTGAAALAAVVLLVQPTGAPLGPSFETTLAPQAEPPVAFSDDVAIESRSAAPAMEEAMMAPQGMADTAIAEAAPTARMAVSDPAQSLEAILASGRLPDTGEVDTVLLTNALAPALGIRPPINYAVPWSERTVLRDSGRRGDPMRFSPMPFDDSQIATELFEPRAPAEIRFVIAVTGFATLLETGASDLNGWTYADALAMARASQVASPQAIALMEMAAGLAGTQP